MEEKFRDLVIFGNKVDLASLTDSGLSEIALDTESLATAKTFLILPRGYLIVRRNFKLFPHLLCDLGFRCQKEYHESRCFYSIPILDSSLSTENSDYEKVIKRGCEMSVKLIREAERSRSTQPNVRRFLVNVYDFETKLRRHLLYEARKGKLDNAEYRVIDDPKHMADFFKYYKFLRNLYRTEKLFLRT